MAKLTKEKELVKDSAPTPLGDGPLPASPKILAGQRGIRIALQGESWKLVMDSLAFWAAFEERHDRVEQALALRSHIERKLKHELRRRGITR